MAVITLRNVKGTPLTNSEVDGNFANLNTEIGEVSGTLGNVITNQGNLEGLSTTDKGNLVAAINEVYQKSTEAANIDLSNVRITGGEITNTDWKGNIVPIQYGGTQANTATQARTNLGLEIGNHVQAWNTNLDDLAALTPTENFVVIGDGTEWTTANIIDLINDGAGGNLGTMAFQDANSITIVDGTASGTFSAALFSGDGGLLSNISGTGGGGGSGLFNTEISQSTGYLLTTSAANALVIPNTDPDARYILHSIHVTNISSEGNANATINLLGTGYATNITLGDSVPLTKNTATEILKKPKILQPGNYIQMVASDANRLHATITLEKSDESAYFGSGVDITVSDTYMIAGQTDANSVIESILLTNDSAGGFDAQVNCTWVNAANVIQGYYCFGMVVPSGGTIELLEKPKFLPANHKIMVSANMPNRIEAIVSGKKDIS